MSFHLSVGSVFDRLKILVFLRKLHGGSIHDSQEIVVFGPIIFLVNYHKRFNPDPRNFPVVLLCSQSLLISSIV